MSRSKCWRKSLGEQGCRVYVFERKPGGTLYREVYLGGSRAAPKKSLGHRNKERAVVDAYKMLVVLKARTHALNEGTLTLEMLFDNYIVSPSHRAKKPRTQREDQRKLERLVAFLGHDRDVRSLSDSDVEWYKQARIRGEYGPSGRPVRARTIEADLVALRTMLNWATRQRHLHGEPLLGRNPLSGIRFPREKNPLRPIATWERFQQTREAIQALRRDATSDNVRMRWLKLELALVLAEATGRRLGSIRQLRWEDVDFDKHVICWRHDADKRGREWQMPMSKSLADELRDYQRRFGAVGGWMFPSERKPNRFMDRHQFDKWLRVAEEHADLPSLQNGLWHPYRRKWGTERKHLPVTDVAAAGGWKDVNTLLTCYQQPDTETLLAVVSEPRKVRDSGVG